MAQNPISPIRVEGNVAFVTLTRGREAIIDAEDVPLVSVWKWFVSVRGDISYAVCAISGRPHRRFQYMHRLISAEGSALHVDHINGNGLDNRRQNLRLATVSQNLRNQRTSSQNTSGQKGVGWHKQRQKWRAYIKVHGVSHHLGLFDSKDEAADAYAKASAELHGEFGRIG